MATTVAQLQVELAALREKISAYCADVDALRKELDATRVTKRTVVDSTTQTYPSAKEAMEACKAFVAEKNGLRYSVTGNVLHIRSH